MEFWASCTALIKEKGYDQELAYMKRMLEHEGLIAFSNQDLRGDGARPDLFPGSAGMFRRITQIWSRSVSMKKSGSD